MGRHGVRLEATDEEIASLLVEHYGVINDVAKALGVDRRTIDRRIAGNELLQEAKKTARDVTGDEVESAFMKLVLSPHWPAMRFYMVTQMRDRGYIETLPAMLASAGLESLTQLLKSFGVDASAMDIIEKVTEIDQQLSKR